MQQQLGLADRGDQPLAMAARVAEHSAAQRPGQRLRAAVAGELAVENVDSLDPPALRGGGQAAAEALDVRKLWQRAALVSGT